MKKRILCLFVLLSLLLTACGSSGAGETPNLAEKPAVEGDDLPITAICRDVTPEGLTLVLTSGEGELSTGSYYGLETFTQEGWKEAQILPQEYEVSWTAIAYILEEKVDRDFSMTWTNLYGELPDGSYRVKKEIWGDDGSYCLVYGYFTLPADNQPDHTHALAAEPETVEDPVSGYCGNMVTKVCLNGKEYSFDGDNSVTLTDILINLSYDPEKVCRCMPEFTVDTESHGDYGVNLSEGCPV